jgi:hypothetical protein
MQGSLVEECHCLATMLAVVEVYRLEVAAHCEPSQAVEVELFPFGPLLLLEEWAKEIHAQGS